MDIVPNPVVNASINFCRIRTLYFHLSSLYFHALPMTSSQLIVTFRQMLAHYSKQTTTSFVSANHFLSLFLPSLFSLYFSFSFSVRRRQISSSSCTYFACNRGWILAFYLINSLSRVSNRR